MNQKALSMKKEIRIISKYRALIISKYYLFLLLILVSLYLGMINYAMSPLYIAIILYFLPMIVGFALKDYAKKYRHKILISIIEESPFLLNHMKSKYKYSKLNYISNAIAYVIALLLIALWQYNYSTMVRINPFLQIIPVLILFSALTLRYLGIIYYQIKLHYDLSHNRVWFVIPQNRLNYFILFIYIIISAQKQFFVIL